MRKFSIWAFRRSGWGPFCLALSFIGVALPAHADSGCRPHANYEVHEFEGVVHGKTRYDRRMGLHRLALEPVDKGWRLRLFLSSGPELSVRHGPHGTPPADVTLLAGMDLISDINSQYRTQGSILRKFTFGKGGPRTPDDPEFNVPSGGNITTVEPNEGDNAIGELIIEDYGLAGDYDGNVPRVSYLKFSGCLGWDQGYRGPSWRNDAEPSVPDETVAAMRHCGFSNHDYTLTEQTLTWGEGGSAFLEADLQGDGVTDFIASVRRNADNKQGLAICLRSDNRLKFAGFDERDADIGSFTENGTFWRVHKSPFKPGAFYPHPAGEAIVMGMGAKEAGKKTGGENDPNRRPHPSILIYMDEDENIFVRRQGETSR